MRLIRKATDRDLPAVNELLRIFEDPGTPVFVLRESGPPARGWAQKN